MIPRWLFTLIQILGTIASALGGLLGLLRSLGPMLAPAALVPTFIAFLSSVVATIRNWLGPAYTTVEAALVRNGMDANFIILVPVAQLIGSFNAVRGVIGEMYSYTIKTFMREVRYGKPNEFPTKEELTIMWLRGIIDYVKYMEEMRYLGYSPALTAEIALIALTPPSPDDIIQNWQRDGDTADPIEKRLAEVGLSSEAVRIALRNATKILTIDQLLQARLKGYIPDTAVFYNMGKQLGYEQPELELLEKANGEPISIGQALDLWNKKEGADLAIQLGVANEIERDWAKGKGEEDVNRAVLEGPLNNYWFPAIKKLRYNMLGAPDYIRFAVRDVYNSVVRAANRLDEGYPEILAAKLRMLGYSPQDAKDAWAAHWELPSPTQVFEMLHRGKLPPGITVEDYLVSADYAPAWRQALTDISYNPITRTDAKRMYKLRGDFDELVRHFKDNGYSEQDALDLAEFTRQDVNLEGNNERQGLASGLKNAVLSMYKGRTISADEVRDILRQLTYTDETIEQFIIEADFFRIQDEKADIANAVKASYVKALRNREDTVALLQQAGWRGQPLDDLMSTWDILRQATEMQPHQSAARDLTKGELLTAFSDGIIDQQQLTDALLQLGYDENEAGVLVQHAVLKKKREDTNLLVELTHQRFLGREIDQGEASIELDKLQVPVTQKIITLKKWSVEREKRVPDFTLAQLEGMISSKVMDEDVARQALRDQGYMDSQVAYLINWWRDKRGVDSKGKYFTKLKRSDVEGNYIDDRKYRDTAVAQLKELGYYARDINIILDRIDKNMNRPQGPVIKEDSK